jgi:hypothetical protein
MLDIQNYIQKLGDDSLSSEEQALALQEIEKSLVQSQLKHEEVVQSSTDLVVEAVKSIEDTVYTKFKELSTSESMKGPKGNNGRDGKDGKDGKDGVGYNGKDGKDGVDGIDGEDGRYVTDVEIDFDDTLLVTLSDNTTIKTTKEIKGPKGDMGPQGLRGSNGNGVVVGGSTGQVLTKVSNTDYDVTWSTNGAGTVTSVGGTGTVNGLSLSGTVTSSGNLTLGGTLDLSAPPAIGATTPAAGTFTTITGQTEVLKGTGQNLVIQSNGFTVALGWAVVASTSTGSQSDPFGGSTASLLTADGTSSGHNLQSTTLAFTSGITYTTSVYFKAGTNNFAQIRMTGAVGGFYGNFNISTGVAGTTTATSSAIVSVGGGWYRASITFVASASASAAVGIFIVTSNTAGGAEVNTLATSITVYGSQIEVGTTANTYIPTTTTAVYGTPTLSFSGVAGLGLESNGALYVSPAGTGALQAQATTSTTVGGNARGANAVDWQTARANANQVASGQYSVVGGGNANRSSAYGNFIGGGESNFASAFDSAAVAGASNSASGGYSFTGGGLNNGSTGSYSTAVGGYFNTATGYNGFVGGGERNSTASSSAVTTQATTAVTSGSTAVTLSGSNANIKVGQLIAGTGIQTYPNQTYVAAISGTSLTLSQNASASGSPTLSFFTPNSVVVGGGNNQATGSYSFIGGGGDAGTAALRNTASGAWSVVVGGRGNTSSGISSFVGAGGTTGDNNNYANTASGTFSAVVAGGSNFATGEGSFIGCGFGNAANSLHSTIAGGVFGTTRGIVGNVVFPACSTPVSGSQGASQAALLILGTQTTDATATALRSNNSSAGTTNQVILPNNSAYFFRGEVVSGVTGGGDTKGWSIEGVIKRGAGVGTTALVGTPTVTSTYADAGASTWVIAVTADTTNGGIRVTFTGQASTTIRTVCQIRTTEMTY